MKEIELFKKGDDQRTALDTDAINELVIAINALLRLKVSPEGAGKFLIEEAGSVLSLADSQPIYLDALINGTLQVIQVNGKVL